MEENFFLAKQLLPYKFSCKYPYKELVIVGLFSLLEYYKDYKDDIISLFLKTDFYIENQSVRDILTTHNIDYINFFDEEDKIEESINATYGLSSHGESISFDEEGNIYLDKRNPFVVCSAGKCSPSILLNVFIHEMNHLIKSYHNSFESFDKEDIIGYSIRTGLNLYLCRYDRSQDIMVEEDYYNTLDEVINVLETSEILQNVSCLKSFITDSSVLNYLNSLDSTQLKKPFGYDLCVQAFYPLWQNDVFRSLISHSILEGDISKIVDGFDSTLGKGAFDNLADSLDELDEIDSFEGNFRKKFFLKRHIKDLIQEYLKQTRNVYRK